MSPGPVVEVCDLSISLGERAASKREILTDVSLGVSRGDFLAIIGRNGAGKSTLFKCIAGIYGKHVRYAGTIRIDGRASAGISARERARHIAYVPQSAPADIPYTVRDLLEMSRYPWKGVVSQTEDKRAIGEAMRLADIEPLASRRLCDLSGGERQRAMIAAAIAQGTACILMDEPTTYLDYAHQIEAMEIMSAVNRGRGTTMMVVTHDVNMAVRAANRIVALAGGRVVWGGSPDELLASNRLVELEKIYGVRFERYTSQGGDGFPLLAPVRGEVAEG